MSYSPTEIIKEIDPAEFALQRDLLNRILDCGDYDVSEEDAERLEGLRTLLDHIVDCMEDTFGIANPLCFGLND